ncbi:hypothetical protein HG535_0D00340 [Zygotorulaspora mrakii]|uniref:Uncharacterized protein n=1 Tax=Zygotorulaspora mrakii TaxID=42260 RepID=A0A7H9B1G9_ZYGMR|nr:uncharacterized protein HG535_0D00340 [Zygotorulaspora mrakii]QLG72327.1 hypothetical protein HG535_0D00340 [Zygotorulaspora mrakii]
MPEVSRSQFSFELPDTVVPGQLICPECDVCQTDGKNIVYRFVSGHGTMTQTYNKAGTQVAAISATLVGFVKVQEELRDLSDNDEPQEEVDTMKDAETNVVRVEKVITISVLQNGTKMNIESSNNDFANNLPKEGDIVLTRVTRISQQRANVEILAVENAAIPVDSGIGSNGLGVIAAQGGSGAATFSIAQASSDLGEMFRGIIRSQDVRATERDTVKIINCFKPGDIVRAQVLSLGDGTNYYLSTARNDLGVVFAKAANGAGGLMYALDWQTMCVPSSGATENRKCAKPF